MIYKHLVIATRNKGKFEEITKEIAGYFEKLYSLNDFKSIGPIKETGKTFLENARIKAETVAKAARIPALADDSGLVVPALKGEPGIYSSRYAGENASDWDNIELLLEKLKTSEDRGAYFVCSLCLASPQGEILWEGEGKCHGVIIDTPKGNNGFGYDPVFLYPPLRKTFAQLTREEKAKISHRGIALNLFKKALDKGIDSLY